MRLARSLSALLLPFGLLGASPCQTAPAPQTVAAENAAAQDPLLAAMQAELTREQSLLLLPGMQRPYYMEYRLDDFASFEAVANYGAVARQEHAHQRIVRVEVRIGEYASDSSSSRGEGSVELAPSENDAAALRYALWSATDEAYKGALRAYATKQAALKRFEKAPAAADFSASPPTVRIEPLASLSLDESAWTRRIAEASGLFLTEPSLKAVAPLVQYSTADVRGVAVNRYLVNTEGTVVRHGYAAYTDSYNVGGQAADGMRLGQDNGATAATAAELDSAEALRQRALTDVRTFAALRDAPVVDADDYHGPVLFSGRASADVLLRLFVPNIEADRPEIGTSARTVGAYQSSLHARVLPETLSVVDDPGVRSLEGRTLLGAYAVDDEGVPERRVDLVTAGKLENYLIGRTPVRDFPASNGHGRAVPGQAAHSRGGVLLVAAAHPLTAPDLRARLLALSKEQGRDVYEVESMNGESSPRLLYRVHPDGSRQLVRGAVFDELDTRSLRSEVLAAGGDPFVDNILGPIPETIVAPALLFGDIGVKRATEQQEKLPYYPPPQ